MFWSSILWNNILNLDISSDKVRLLIHKTSYCLKYLLLERKEIFDKGSIKRIIDKDYFTVFIESYHYKKNNKIWNYTEFVY